MRILVTGGTGFIGSHIIRRVQQNCASLSHVKTNKNGHYYADIRDKKSLMPAFSNERPEYIFHLAAQVNPRMSMESPASDIETNLMGTINILDMCRKYGAKKIIFSSTSAVYGEPKYLPVDEKHETLPVSIYGASKLVAEKYIEMYCRAYGIKYTILRYANVYGPGSRSVISIFIEKMMKDKRPIVFGDGTQTRDFVYINDVVDATISAIKNADNLRLNIGTRNGTSIKKIFTIVRNQLSSDARPIYKPEIKGEIKKIFLDTSLAKRHLKWLPSVDINSGIKKIISG